MSFVVFGYWLLQPFDTDTAAAAATATAAKAAVILICFFFFFCVSLLETLINILGLIEYYTCISVIEPQIDRIFNVCLFVCECACDERGGKESCAHRLRRNKHFPLSKLAINDLTKRLAESVCVCACVRVFWNTIPFEDVPPIIVFVDEEDITRCFIALAILLLDAHQTDQ